MQQMQLQFILFGYVGTLFHYVWTWSYKWVIPLLGFLQIFLYRFSFNVWWLKLSQTPVICTLVTSLQLIIGALWHLLKKVMATHNIKSIDMRLTWVHRSTHFPPTPRLYTVLFSTTPFTSLKGCRDARRAMM